MKKIIKHKNLTRTLYSSDIVQISNRKTILLQIKDHPSQKLDFLKFPIDLQNLNYFKECSFI